MKIDFFKMPKILVFPISILFAISGCELGVKPISSPYTIVYSSKESKGREIYLSDEKGESRIKVTDFTRSDGYPSVSPDGERLAFYGKYDDRKTWSIHTVNIDGTNMQRLTKVKHVWDSAPSWSPDGKMIVFAREYDDPEKGWQEEIWLMNEDGSEQHQIEALEGRAPYFLHDGRILFHSKTEPNQIFIANADGNNLIQLTNNDANNWSPKISPDGNQVVFVSDRDGNREIYTINIDGSNQKRMTFNDVDDWDPDWSDDGTKLLFASDNSDGYSDIYQMNRDGSAIEKIINNGIQASTVRNLNKLSLERLIKARQ
jgi:TolB protein